MTVEPIRGTDEIGPARQARSIDSIAIGQHGACGLPMILVGVSTRELPYHPDQISIMKGRGENPPEMYQAQVETWQCPCGCSKIDREGRSSLEGNIG